MSVVVVRWGNQPTNRIVDNHRGTRHDRRCNCAATDGYYPLSLRTFMGHGQREVAPGITGSAPIRATNRAMAHCKIGKTSTSPECTSSATTFVRSGILTF